MFGCLTVLFLEKSVYLQEKTSNMNNLYQNIAAILQEARSRSYRAINTTMIEAYWNIGQQIVEEEQQGKHRAEYGSKLLPYLSKKLQTDFGKGFNTSNLAYMKQFYLSFPIFHAVRGELTWTHYRLLLKVANEKARNFYISESIDNQWNTRVLERNINSFFYERILSSNNEALAKSNTQDVITAKDIIKDPYVLEFFVIFCVISATFPLISCSISACCT